MASQNAERIKNLQENIENVYYKIAPLLPHWEAEVLNIRKGFEKELAETIKIIMLDWSKNKKSESKIIAVDAKLKKKMDEYTELLKIKYMRLELDFFNSLKIDVKK